MSEELNQKSTFTEKLEALAKKWELPLEKAYDRLHEWMDKELGIAKEDAGAALVKEGEKLEGK